MRLSLMHESQLESESWHFKMEIEVLVDPAPRLAADTALAADIDELGALSAAVRIVSGNNHVAASHVRAVS